MVAVPSVSCAVAVNAAVEDPAGMVTVDGTVTIPLLLLVRLTVTPPVPATCPMVTDKVPAWFALRSSGDGEKEMLVFGPTVIVTVDGGELRSPSLTISSAL
jgi:hypothetical protein